VKEILNNFQSGKWLPADQIVRPFVGYPNSNVSPGEVWQCSPEKSKKYLSVIIPTCDAYRNGYFLKLLSQIESQDYNDFELIVVRGDPRQGRAINTGAAIANGKYLLTLDDDTSLPDPDTFGKLVDVMESHPAIAAAGGNNVIPEGAGRFLQKAMKQIPRRSWKPVETITDSDLAEHPLLMMRADVFKSVGGENELIPRGLDPYLRREFRRAGYRVVVVPGANYSHFPPNTLSKSIKQFYGNGKQAAFCNKFYPQWVFETPDNHVSDFMERREFAYRIARYFVNMVKSTFKGNLIYVTVSIAYAIGFIKGYVCYRNETQS
jgi:glycosyltransferase involved in cell wall biosynthesis